MAGDDWVTEAADGLERGVTRIRRLTTDKVVVAVRYVVFGLLAVILGVTALILATVLLIRFVDVWLPGEVWSAYLLVGGMFLAGGLFVWPRRAISTPPA